MSRTSAPVAPRSSPEPSPLPRSAQARALALRSAPDGASVQIELSSTTQFTPRDSRLLLRVGNTTLRSTVQGSSDLTRVVFTVDRKSFDALRNGDPVRVSYQGGTDIEWDFGALDKSKLAP